MGKGLPPRGIRPARHGVKPSVARALFSPRAACSRGRTSTGRGIVLPSPTAKAAFRRELTELAAARERLPPGRGRWIYGAGGFGRSLASELNRIGHPALGFIDRRARDLDVVDGLPCRHPDDVGPGDADGALYLHGVMNPDAASAAAVDWAEGQGFATAFPSDLFRIPGFALRHYWLDDPAVTLDGLAAIEEALDLLDDEASRDLVRSILRYRLHCDPRREPAFTPGDLYAPDFLPIFDRPITFVDAGAYTGDSLKDLVRSGVTVADWIAIEPDERNAERLRLTAAEMKDAVPSCTILQAGLSDRDGIVRFSSDGTQSSRILAVGETDMATDAATEIRVVGLDGLIRRPAPLYVKMDIEGAEEDALLGMTRLLAERPILAVSVYHRAADLWEIPRLVARHYDRPRMRIRQHRHHAFDTVLYVWPG